MHFGVFARLSFYYFDERGDLVASMGAALRSSDAGRGGSVSLSIFDHRGWKNRVSVRCGRPAFAMLVVSSLSLSVRLRGTTRFQQVSQARPVFVSHLHEFDTHALARY